MEWLIEKVTQWLRGLQREPCPPSWLGTTRKRQLTVNARGESAAELEGNALRHAQQFFGPGAQFRVARDYVVTMNPGTGMFFANVAIDEV